MDLLDAFARVPSGLPAVRFGGRVLTYEQLRARVAGLRDALERRGLRPGDRVAVSLPHGLEAPAAVLAAWSAGLVAVPLEPRLPPERVARVLERSDARALVVSGRRGQSLIRRLGAPWTERAIEDWSDGQPRAPVRTDGAASVLFTSGSSGAPKGVIITREHVDAFTWHWSARVGLAPGARVGQAASLAFDLSLFDLGATLRSGATLVPVPEALLAFPGRAVDLLIDQAVTHVYAVPSLLGSLLEAGLATRDHRLQVLMSAGEVLPARLARKLLAELPGVRLLNLFGPTETNVSCAWEVPPDFDGDEVPIGHACPYLDVRLVDGELVARGATVTPGYLGEPERGRWLELDGARWLRTGDRVRREAGLLWFEGRIDRMVKLDGYRVEPEEVERALLVLPGVAEAAVVALPGTQRGSARALVAFVAPVGLDEQELQAGLRRRLPGWAVPGRIVGLDALPRSPRGKVDLERLTGLAAGP